MVNKFLNRSLGWVLSVCMLFSGVTATASQSENTNLFQPGENHEQNLRTEENEQVRIIVELEEAPVLSYSGKMRAFSSNADFFRSDAAQEIESVLAENRKIVEKSLMRSDMDITINREYSAVLNSFSVYADIDDLEAIKNTEGVKNAFAAGFHKLIAPVGNMPKLTGSVPAIGGDIAGEDLGYTGKGTAIAIIDTGLDTSHEAFGAVNSPKYTMEDIEALRNNNKLTIGMLSISAVYKSEKIPYAYDYADIDTNVSGGDSHGTHVAGISGANSGGVVRGVAPDAQLFIMKVFGDSSGGAYDDDILAALDDAVKLGVDSINMSLGTTAEFSEDAAKTVRQVYKRVEQAGIGLYCAAGNEYSSAYHNTAGNDLPKASEPDNGTVASPSTYSAAMSVASMNNTETTSVYFTVGNKKIRYNDSAEDVSKQLISLSGSYEFVDCGVGGAANYQNKSLRGKVALIRRAGEENGEVLTFAQKEAYAKAAGAAAAIIYDNVDGTLVSMSTDNNIPCVFISRSDGEYMCAAADKTIVISEDYIDTFKDSSSGQMSDFSSWGVTPDLKLKPEITAPGGEIYSTLPGGLYGNMSGTSMASPHMAGAASVMDQYIREEQNGLNMSPAEKTVLANALMMSTAVPIRDDRNIFYSPRKQGAGLVQLNNAVAAGAYLTNTDGGRPKGELGDNTLGEYEFSFDVNSISDTDISYEPTVTVLTESTVVEDGITYMAQCERELGTGEVKVEIPDKITVSAGNKKTVAVKISLTETGKHNSERDFPNGIYVEGYVTLKPITDGEVTLSYPFMGFYGDWSEIPLFDSNIYDDKGASLYEMQLGQFRNYDGGGYILGHNIYVDGNDKYSADKIAIQGGDNTKNVTAVTSLLRNADSLTFSVEDSDENTVYSETMSKIQKTYYMDEAFYTPMAEKGWTPFDTWNSPLDDGNYTYTVTGEAVGKSQSVSFPIVIDSIAPEVISSTVEGSQWKITVHDNHYIQALCVTASGDSALTDWTEPEADSANAYTEVVFDLSESIFKGLKQAKIAMVDYAGNQYISEYYSLEGASVVYPESVTLNKTEIIMTEADSTQLSASVLPENASNRTVTWSSSDSSVATVSDKGTVNALKAGKATITAETVNGLKAVCVITVNEKQIETSPVIASVSAPAAVTEGSVLPFDFSLEKIARVATVSFTFEKDSELSFLNLSGRSGFTPLGIKWNDDNTGVAALSYLQDGAGGCLTKEAICDIARIEFETESIGEYGIRLTGVAVSGYDENGKAVYFTTSIASDSAKIAVSKQDRYDLNRDGVVDLLDITYCQKFYRMNSGLSGWADIAYCDLDGSGIIDVQDMIILLQFIY
ncbi:MAG: S8 family serine peptidase [Clostridia bacterium]|nr:S8 family serine peptidase [Clostridia bacterium]